METELERTKKEVHTTASLVVDALITAGLIRERDGDKAVEIAEEEIMVRKAMGRL